MRIRGLPVILLPLFLVTVLGTGCETNARRVLLKEYGPTVPNVANAPLKGATVFIKSFDSVPSLVGFEPKTEPEDVKSFTYVDFTPEQNGLWDKQMRDLQKQMSVVDCKEIGNTRNFWGAVISNVYVLNDAGAWLTESLKYDLEAQGAKIVDASQAASADVSISGTIQLCRLDTGHFMINGDLVVDLDLQPKQGEACHKQIHTQGSTLASLASEGEYYHAIREARQKFAILAINEIAKTLGPKQ